MSDEDDATISSTVVHWRIAAMDCLSEENEIRQALARVAGIQAVNFDLATRSLRLQASTQAQHAAAAAIRRLGYVPEPWSGAATDTDADPAAAACSSSSNSGGGCSHCPASTNVNAGADANSSPGRAYRDFIKPLLALGLATSAELLHLLASTSSARWAGMLLAALAIYLAGSSTFRKGLAALRHAHLNINALMTVAVSGAFLIGDWPEAAMVMALYALAELIEARAVLRARGAIGRLLDLAPATAEVQDAQGHWHEQPARSLQPGMRLRVLPGARFAVDGRVLSGNTTVDESALSGESLPIDKLPGDTVHAGTINGAGLLEIEATTAADNTLLARIIHAVESAQAQRAPTQRFIDRFAAIYTPLIFFIALAVALLGPLLFAWPWLTALYRALVLLVIACPCALVIATPVTLVSALAAAARRGMLIKGGAALEIAGQLRLVAFDKTGTLTHGQPQLVAHEILTNAPPTAQASHAHILTLASCLAAHSDHPVSQAIVRGLSELSQVAHCPIPPQDYTALPGRGISATHGDDAVWLGNRRLIAELGLLTPQVAARLAEHEALGRSITLLADRHAVQALFAVADTLRDEARPVIAALHQRGLHTALLSGDNARTAAVIAAAAGIEEARVRAELLPTDKQAALAALQQNHGVAAMVGDGINDAPALAQAELGIAMGGIGSDVALETASVVIMNDDLRRIPELLQLAQRTHTILWQNILLALGIKLIFLVLALLGVATLWMAVFADTGATLLVVLNGLRMLRRAVPRHA